VKLRVVTKEARPRPVSSQVLNILAQQVELHQVEAIAVAAAGRRREESQMHRCPMDQTICDQVTCEAFKKQFQPNGVQQKHQGTQRKVHQDDLKKMAQI
jgi:hypothetical protein